MTTQIYLKQEQLMVEGELSFATVKALWLSSLELFKTLPILSFDLSGVTTADSAGLALLIEWVKWAKQHSKSLRYQHLPSQMKTLAKAAGVDELLAAYHS